MSELGVLGAAARQARVVAAVSHRPWPLPDGDWAQAQTRQNVLFAHWRVGLDALARLLPPGLAADTFEGEAWVGIAASQVTNLRVRGLPPLPGLASFPQLEVRTPVTVDGRAGVWLFSLEVGKPLLAEAAKRAHRLPAYGARMTIEETSSGTSFSAVRDGLELGARYRGSGEAVAAGPGTLAHFLVERYAIYTADGGRLYRVELHHAPWRLQAAHAAIESATIVPIACEETPHALVAAEQDLLIWPLEEL